VAAEAVGAAVDDGLDRPRRRGTVLLKLQEAASDGVHVPARVQGVEPQDQDVEPCVPAQGLVLDAADVRGDDYGAVVVLRPHLVVVVVAPLNLDANAASDALCYGAGGDLGLGLADVGRTVFF
jgi:hypothetical protein